MSKKIQLTEKSIPIPEAASLLNLPASALAAARKAGCPSVTRNGWCRPEETREWMAAHQGDVSAAVEAGDLKDENLRLKNQALRAQIAKLEGKSVPIDEIRPALAALSSRIGSTLVQKLTVEWPSQCAGQDAARLRVVGAELHGSIRRDVDEFIRGYGVTQ